MDARSEQVNFSYRLPINVIERCVLFKHFKFNLYDVWRMFEALAEAIPRLTPFPVRLTIDAN